MVGYLINMADMGYLIWASLIPLSSFHCLPCAATSPVGSCFLVIPQISYELRKQQTMERVLECDYTFNETQHKVGQRKTGLNIKQHNED